MSYITTTHTKASKVNIYFEEYGSNTAQETIILIHGWPLSLRMWEPQIMPLINAGYRVIAYDRRGFGDSDHTWDGHDYESLTADLNDLLQAQNITNATLVGFSMGGGEVAHYMGNYDISRIKKVAFISAVTPFLLKTDDNLGGVDNDVFVEMEQAVLADRLHFLDGFGKKFVNWDKLFGETISKEMLDYSFQIAAFASPRSSYCQIGAFARTDFRTDIAKMITVPVLIVHGDSDQIVPIQASGARLAKIIPDAIYKVIENAPHGLTMTHAEEFNTILLDFIKS
ncbi:MAG: alpha/beta hydrolase [candidate division SR1 bacterium]|nr:alpha/beta hydrolase [candidate division SR1 bacterium]